MTGASGFIGSAVCRHLLRHGFLVRALHRPSSDLSLLEGLAVERRAGDILAPDSLASAVSGARWVFHVAAESAHWRQRPEQVIRAAVDGTHNVVGACLRAGVERLVLTSSLAALGVPLHSELLTEAHVFNLPAHRFPYGYAKRQAEIEAARLAGSALQVVIVNPSIVLGAGDAHQISGSLVVQAARGLTFFYTGGGTNIVHIDDVAAGHLAAAERGRTGERYILGGENLSYQELITLLAEAVGGPRPWLRIPDAAIGPAASLIDVARHVLPLPLNGYQLRLSRYRLFCDTRKARDELDLAQTRPTRQAIVEALAWYRAQGVA